MRTVHQIWLGSPLPGHLARLADTWREHHPHWNHRLWDQEAIDTLDMPYRDVYDQAPQIVPHDAIWQFRSDLARWAILRDHGGIYADTDTWALRPIDELLTAPMVLGWEIQDRWVGVSTIYAEPHHPATHAAIDRIDHLTRTAHPGTRPNKLTGPKALSPILRRRKDLLLLPERYWYPVRWNRPTDADSGHFPDSYVIHGWQHQRDLKGLPPCGSKAPSKTAPAPTPAP